ncbi:MAG: hypothetical protein Fur0042_27300 [Cyanophyceae cyanobacterium]
MKDWSPMSDPSLQGDPATLEAIAHGVLSVVNSRRRNGVLLVKPYYAEFAGPGAAVGGEFDRDCLAAIPIGNLQLLTPQNSTERQTAYRIRLQWLKLTSRFTVIDAPAVRSRQILEQFEQYFERDQVYQVSHAALAMVVGVFPQTMAETRGRHALSFIKPRNSP